LILKKNKVKGLKKTLVKILVDFFFKINKVILLFKKIKNTRTP